MSDPAPSAPVPARASTETAGHRALMILVALATAAAAVTANPLLAVIPVVAVTCLYLVIRVPLRWSVAALILLLLVPDDTMESLPGQWRTPLAILGDLIHFRLNAVTGIPGLAVTGLEVMVVILFGVWLHRNAGGDQTDRVARPPSVVRWFLILYLAGVLYSEAFGLLRGLQVAPWKVRNLVHVPMLAALFMVTFSGVRDAALLGRLVVFAAAVRSVLAVVVQRFAVADTGGDFAYATSHGDSLLFAVGLFLVLADLMERPDRRRLLRAALLVPLIVLGGIENQRRSLWVMVPLTLGAAYLLSPMKGWKLAVTRIGVVAIPVVALYVGAGWNSPSGVFAPVRTLRSVIDTSTDRSAYWREVENWNIAVSLREMPVTGLGLGGEYTEVMANDSVAEGYKEYREWPHNTYLGLLLLMGLFGFTVVFALSSLVVFLSVRSYRLAVSAEQRVVAMGCLGTVIAAQVLAWGDTGAHFPQFKVLLALAVAVSASLATTTGAWKDAPARPRAQGAGGGS